MCWGGGRGQRQFLFALFRMDFLTFTLSFGLDGFRNTLYKNEWASLIFLLTKPLSMTVKLKKEKDSLHDPMRIAQYRVVLMNIVGEWLCGENNLS